jgi:hypothetical protein
MKIVNTGAEVTIVKWTFILVFGGITLLFVGKIAALVMVALQAKVAALQLYLHSGKAAGDLSKVLWEAIKGGK